MNGVDVDLLFETWQKVMPHPYKYTVSMNGVDVDRRLVVLFERERDIKKTRYRVLDFVFLAPRISLRVAGNQHLFKFINFTKFDKIFQIHFPADLTETRIVMARWVASFCRLLVSVQGTCWNRLKIFPHSCMVVRIGMVCLGVAVISMSGLPDFPILLVGGLIDWFTEKQSDHFFIMLPKSIFEIQGRSEILRISIRSSFWIFRYHIRYYYDRKSVLTKAISLWSEYKQISSGGRHQLSSCRLILFPHFLWSSYFLKLINKKNH